MRPKKEDWLKKKDRKQRRPGCRRKKTRKEGELLSRAPLFHLRLSSVLGTATSLTDQLTDTSTPTLTSRQLQRLPNNPRTRRLEDVPRPSGGFPPGAPVSTQPFFQNNSKQKIFFAIFFFLFNKNFYSF